jgi:acetoin utilization deacetylase AcuC-like enzyme
LALLNGDMDDDDDDDHDDGDYTGDDMDNDDEPRRGMLDVDTFANEFTNQATTMGVGAVFEGVELVLQGKYRRAFCAIRPPGHHAGRSGVALRAPSQGFCIYNNVALGAMKAKHTVEAAINRRRPLRVLVYDFDVHHGTSVLSFDASAQFWLILLSRSFAHSLIDLVLFVTYFDTLTNFSHSRSN